MPMSIECLFTGAVGEVQKCDSQSSRTLTRLIGNLVLLVFVSTEDTLQATTVNANAHSMRFQQELQQMVSTPAVEFSELAV
jgi:hypothetical protein